MFPSSRFSFTLNWPRRSQQCVTQTDGQSDRRTNSQTATCDPLHLHAAGLDATLGEPLLGDDAADVVGKDEVGLKDGQRLGVRVGAGLVDDDVERPAVVLHARHLHVLFDGVGGGGWSGGGSGGEVIGGGRVEQQDLSRRGNYLPALHLSLRSTCKAILK